MRRLHVGSNVTVFLLFFGLALMEAMLAKHWLLVLFWLAIGFVFLLGDSPRLHHGRHPKSPR
jgi:hypothetical protein